MRAANKEINLANKEIKAANKNMKAAKKRNENNQWKYETNLKRNGSYQANDVSSSQRKVLTD